MIRKNSKTYKTKIKEWNHVIKLVTRIGWIAFYSISNMRHHILTVPLSHTFILYFFLFLENNRKVFVLTFSDPLDTIMCIASAGLELNRNQNRCSTLCFSYKNDIHGSKMRNSMWLLFILLFFFMKKKKYSSFFGWYCASGVSFVLFLILFPLESQYSC